MIYDIPDVVGGGRPNYLPPEGTTTSQTQGTPSQTPPATNSSPVSSQAPVAVPMQIVTLKDFIKMMGDRFEQKNPNDFKRFAGEDGVLNWEDLDQDKDGKITRSELQALIDARVIDEELFNLLANAGVVRQGSDGEISKEDLEKALSVINKYAQWKGISSEEAAKIYLDPATTFQNANLDALLEAKQSIQEAVGGLNFSDIKSENSLRNALVSLNYRQEIIDQVVALITDYQKLTVDFVVKCIVDVIDKARVEGKIDSNSITKASILGWLRGGMGIEEQVDDHSITEDPRFKKIFLWDYRMDRLLVAVDYLKQLIEAGKLPTAKRALELIQARALERGKMPELLNLENHNGLMYLFAMGYAKKAKESGRSEYLRASFDVAQKLTERKDEVLSYILSICLENVDVYYDLAQKVVDALASGDGRYKYYLQIAVKCLESREEKVRENAVKLLGNIPGKTSLGAEYREVLISFQAQGIHLPQEGEMTADVLLEQVKDLTKMPIDVLKIRDKVLKSDGNLKDGAEVKEALGELDKIIKNDKNEEKKAYALMVKAEILRAQAKALNPEAKEAEGKYKEMAETACQAALIFEKLKDQTSNPNSYYDRMLLKANGVIAEVLKEMLSLTEKKGYGLGLGQTLRWAYQKLCKMMVQYIPKGTKVPNIFNERGEPLTSAVIKDKFNIHKDKEDPNVEVLRKKLGGRKEEKVTRNKIGKQSKVKKKKGKGVEKVGKENKVEEKQPTGANSETDQGNSLKSILPLGEIKNPFQGK